MAYPPPPGHASLPAKPPASTVPSSKPSSGAGFKPAFAAFAPRTVAVSAPAPRSSGSTTYSLPPNPVYHAQPVYSAAPQISYASQTQYENPYQDSPQIKNPFASTTGGIGSNALTKYDPEYEAQVQQWQSAYTNKEDKSTHGVAKTATPVPAPDPSPAGTQVQRTVQREGGGTKWTDSTLLEWDPAHFRIFVGNLAGEVTDDSLLKAFIKYPSVQKARVVRDKRTTKSKGFGFVSFANGDDYFQAAREMQGKYIGSHPVLIKRAMTEVKPVVVHDKQKGKHKKSKGEPGGHEQVEYGGIQKKHPKTKGGLRVIG